MDASRPEHSNNAALRSPVAIVRAPSQSGALHYAHAHQKYFICIATSLGVLTRST